MNVRCTNSECKMKAGCLRYLKKFRPGTFTNRKMVPFGETECHGLIKKKADKLPPWA